MELKSHVIVISGIIKSNYSKQKCDTLIDMMKEFNNEKFDDRIYLDLYKESYQDKECIGIGIRIVKPTQSKLESTLRVLRKNIKIIFDTKLITLVKTDNVKIY